MAWQKAATVDMVGEDSVVGVTIAGKDIALYRLGTEFFATGNICTHAFAYLSDGWVEDGKVECPLHQGLFDIRTGKATCAPLTTDIATYPVKVEGDDLLVDV
jgi:nitrite reductase/ring-hydroxylating ferredoxin subunit